MTYTTSALYQWFVAYGAKISQPHHPGRPRVDAEIRQLLRKMAQDGWSAPRIHAELTKLGFLLSEMTVSRYLPRRPAEPDPVKRWVAFLRHHKDDIAAMELIAVPGRTAQRNAGAGAVLGRSSSKSWSSAKVI